MAHRIKLGLIGCGRIADVVHLDALPRLEGAELVALAEVDPARRERARRRVPPAAAFEDYRELLSVAELDAVVICLPNALHAEATATALQHRKHVYLEKPIATSLDDARRVLKAWERAGVVGMMGFNYRFNPLYVEAKRQLDAGRLGSLVAARSVFSTVARADLAWRGSRRQGGGVLLDLAPHHVDLMRFLFGREVQEVSATLRSLRSEDDTAMVQLRFGGGLLAQSFFCLSAVEEDRLEVYGEAGWLSVDRYLSFAPRFVGPTRAGARRQQLRHGVRSLARAGYALEKLRAPGHEPSYAAALARFVAAVRGRCPGSPDFRDGYHSLAAVEAAELSARSGRAVQVGHFPAPGGSEPPRDRGRPPRAPVALQ